MKGLRMKQVALSALGICCMVSVLVAAPTTQPTSAPTTFPAAPADARLTPAGWFAPSPAVQHPPLPENITRAYVIPIREPITQKTFEVLQRKVIQCRTGGAQLVIFDMDTWGGEVIAALDITRLIKTELADVYTVCYVHDRAISAGAMIAMSCNGILTSRVGKLGDCAPIMQGQKLEGVEREKIETVLRTEFKESALRNGYNVPLSEAMVSIHTEVWLVRNRETGELRYVSAADYRDRTLIPGAKNPPPNAEWERLRVIDSPNVLLTMTAPEAVNYGFARAIVPAPTGDPLGEVLKYYNVSAPAVVLEDTWLESFVGFLTSPLVSGILVMLGILFIYIEMHMPGFGVAGTLAIICFAILFGSHYLLGLANYWEIALFVVGLVLIAVEVFAIPGFGVVGIAGILCCLAGLVAMVIPNAPNELPLPRTNLDWELFESGLLSLGFGFVGAIILGVILSRYLPKLPVLNRLILPDATAATDAPVAETDPLLKIQSGDTGVVTAMCRPAGKVRFGDDLLDAQSEGEIIERGATVRVLRRSGSTIIVERAT